MPSMMKLSLGCALLAACAAVAAASPLVALEGGRVSAPYGGWALSHEAHPSHPVELILALRHPAEGVEELERVALAVSDPASPSYGRHISGFSANALVAPAPEAVAAVRSWLAAEGVDEARVTATTHSDFVKVHTHAAEASRLLGGAPYVHYRHASSGRVITRLAEGHAVRLPQEVADAVVFAAPATHFPREKLGLMRRPKPETLAVTTGWLLELYGAVGTSPSNPNNTAAVQSFIGQYYQPSDITTYEKLFANFTSNNIVKNIGPAVGSPGDEASLDVQVLTTMSRVPTWNWYVKNEETPFLQWLLDASNMTDAELPKVSSASYGDNENGISAEYAQRTSTEFAKLAARGVSVLIAAGDSGVGGNCSDDGTFSPDFPASSPWVTTVGGAAFGTPGQFPTGETVDGIGGGGFSNVFPQPAWQKAAVEGYLSSGVKLPPAKLWNATGRAYPDTAAQSEGFVIVLDGIPIPGVGGTSCATPTVSSIVALLNELRLNAGKPALGFLNPLIYSNGASSESGFSDFVKGQNEGCTLAGGFNAAKGWDAASGFGSPNYERLAKAVQQLA